ncbi:hypothetical protein EV426DRAFT_580743 [Tirmania nivea]|nr:hypothetical protein EV426DRAFT_580743 [Tirmania nivea]
MDRELIGRHHKYLQDLQQATTISVASMLTLETEDVMDQVTVLDPGVAESAEAWLKFNEDAVIYNRNPDVLPVSTIIQAGIPQSMQPSSIVDSEEILATLPAEPPKVPTVSEAISQLDDLATFFQRVSRCRHSHSLILSARFKFLIWWRQSGMV